MRLNKAVRDEISHNATKALREKSIAMEKREVELAVRCYNVAFPPKVRKLIYDLRALSAGARWEWFKHDYRLTFNVAGQTVAMRGYTIVADVDKGSDRERYVAVPQGYYVGSPLGVPIKLDTNKGLVDDVRAWQADSEKLKAEIATAERTLKVLLKTVGSTETLFKAWPEGKEFYSTPPLTPASKISVPAVQMQALNTMLGLS